MRFAAALLILAGTAFAAPPAFAWTAAELREACADGELYYIYGACTGYLIAIADTLPAGEVCLPAEGTAFVIEAAADAVPLASEVADETAPALARRVLESTHAC